MTPNPKSSRGYFGIGAESISKSVNLGGLLRSANAFGASFTFTVGADDRAFEMRSDTSKADTHVPVFHWKSVDEVQFPKGCSLVGVELLNSATDLPSFPHPLQCAYVLGPERGVLSAELLACCDHVIRIPTNFSLNVATAGAIVMYDRLRALGRFAPRPISEGTEAPELAPHIRGEPRRRSQRARQG